MSERSTQFTVRDPHYQTRVQESFDAQAVMRLFGARLTRIAPGECDVVMPMSAQLTQQGGVLHAGVSTTLLDTAAGFAAMTLMAPGFDVLSVEFKIHLLAPAAGERFVAKGCVKRPGRTLTVTEASLFAQVDGAPDKEVAALLGTMIAHAKP